MLERARVGSNTKSLAPPHLVHIALGHIFPVGQLTQILERVLGKGHPKGIFIQHLKAGKAQLGRGRPRTALSDFVAEAKGFGDGEQGVDGEGLRAGC